MTTLSVADAGANVSKLSESAATTHERFEVTRNGDRVAVLLSAGDYDSLLETVDSMKHDFASYWSRRITDEHHLAYKVPGSEVRIAACRYRYD